MTDPLVLTIDSGTTNSRARLWRGDTLLGSGQAAVGVRDTALTGNRTALTVGLRGAIDQALASINAQPQEIGVALASGMITSSLGLLEVPHVLAPASAADLARTMREASIPELCGFPVWFIPGMRHDRSPTSPDTVGAMDMMRGEETETFGLIERLGKPGPIVALFPGSHAKFVFADEEQRLTGCMSTLSGEMLDVLSRHTVLASGLRLGWPETLDQLALLAGARLSCEQGLNRAAFSTRVLELFSPADERARFCFLLGAVLVQDLLAYRQSASSDSGPLPTPARGRSGTPPATLGSTPVGIAADVRSAAHPLIICGQPLVQAAYTVLARWTGGFGTIDTPEPSTLDNLAATGAIAIAKCKGLL